MKLTNLITLLLSLNSYSLFANPIQRANQDPVIEDPKMLGTGTSLEEVNTAPNTTPTENESEEFRGTLLNNKKTSKKLKEEMKKKEAQEEKK